MSDQSRFLICKTRKDSKTKEKLTERKQEFSAFPCTVGNEQLHHTILSMANAGFPPEINLLL